MTKTAKSSSKSSRPPASAPTAAYLPLARKYRPQTFDELVGQPHASTTLRRALETQRLGQAFLFAGQRGVGKTSAARILAKALNCECGPTPTPCRSCESCRAIEAGNSLDVIEIDGASNRGIDDIRQLREQVKLAPLHGAFRVYIIDEVHQITADAFNALLKTLEEPPPHVKFIFATTAPQKVPATIVSRCQRFEFRRLDRRTIVEALTRVAAAERLEAEPRALEALARAADGSLRDAEVLFEQVANFCDGPVTAQAVRLLLGSLELEAVAEIAQAILAQDAKAALTVLHRLMDAGHEPTHMLTALLDHLRHVLIASAVPASKGPSNDAREAMLDLAEDERSAVEAQAAAAPTEELLLILQVFIGAYELIRRSPFAQVILECAVLKAAARDHWVSVSQVTQELRKATGPSTPSLSGPPASPTTREGLVALETVQQQWPQVLERLGARKMSVAAYLADSRPVSLQGSLIQIGVPSFRLHQEVLSSPDVQRLIESILVEVIGEPVSISYTTLPEPPAAASAGARGAASSLPPAVQDIVTLFNARVLDQPS